MKKLFFLLLTILVCNNSLLAETNKTIRFGTEATYPPFEFFDKSGQIEGFDIDLAKRLCQEMKAYCTFKNQSFNSLIPSLNLGKFDAIIGAIGITNDRQKQVSFTDAYYEPTASFVAPLAKHYTMQDLLGKTIGVQLGTTFVKYMTDKYHNNVTLKTYASVQDAFLDLVSGRVDAVISDTPIAIIWLKQNSNSKHFGIVDKPIVDHAYFGTGYGIAVRKNDQPLLDALNKALREIKANGSYDELIKKYFVQ